MGQRGAVADRALTMHAHPAAACAELSPRVRQLHGEGAFDVLARARALEAGGARVAHLEVGEPDFATPAHVLEAGLRALGERDTRYGPAAGLPELRAAIAAASSARGVVTDPEDVIVTPGGKTMLFYALAATVADGDEVLVPDPGFPAYASITRFAGGTPVSYEVSARSAFALDPESIAARMTQRTRVIVVNAPHNPTGGSADERALQLIAELAAEHDVFVIADEVYDSCVYDRDRAPSIAAIPDVRELVVVVNSFSKTYAMTGWRLGFGIVPPRARERFTTLAVNGHSCVPPFVQRAGIAAIEGPQTDRHRMVDEFRRRRDWLVAQLNAVPGVTCHTPAGAFYVFPDVRGVLRASGLTTQELADRLLGRYAVAALPGTAFGRGGDGHLRFSFATSMDTLEFAVEGVRRCFADAIAGRLT